MRCLFEPSLPSSLSVKPLIFGRFHYVFDSRFDLRRAILGTFAHLKCLKFRDLLPTSDIFKSLFDLLRVDFAKVVEIDSIWIADTFGDSNANSMNLNRWTKTFFFYDSHTFKTTDITISGITTMSSFHANLSWEANSHIEFESLSATSLLPSIISWTKLVCVGCSTLECLVRMQLPSEFRGSGRIAFFNSLVNELRCRRKNRLLTIRSYQGFTFTRFQATGPFLTDFCLTVRLDDRSVLHCLRSLSLFNVFARSSAPTTLHQLGQTLRFRLSDLFDLFFFWTIFVVAFQRFILFTKFVYPL